MYLIFLFINLREPKKTKKQKKKEEEERKAAEAKAAEAKALEEALAKQRAKKAKEEDMGAIFNTYSKVDYDYIPGLDGDELMIIMPGAFEQALKEGIEKKKKKEREKLEEAAGAPIPTEGQNDTTMEKYQMKL